MTEQEWDVVDTEGLHYQTRADMRISSDSDGLGWCGCGDQERLVEMLVDYLDALSGREPSGDWTESWARVKAMGDVGMLLSFACDAAGWTEHGGSVLGAWLTDEGRAALADLRTYDPN